MQTENKIKITKYQKNIKVGKLIINDRNKQVDVYKLNLGEYL